MASSFAFFLVLEDVFYLKKKINGRCHPPSTTFAHFPYRFSFVSRVLLRFDLLGSQEIRFTGFYRVLPGFKGFLFFLVFGRFTGFLPGKKNIWLTKPTSR